MATLGGIDIGTGLYKENLYSNKVESIFNRARSGSILVWEQESGPQGFDLVGSSNTGVLKKSVLDQIEVLASTIETTIDLVYNGETIPVIFRHWDGPEGAIEANGLVPRELMTDNDYYNNVRIKLHEATWR